MIGGKIVGWACVCAALCLPALSAAESDAAMERHRNLGKAFFENPTTHEQAIAEFKQALDLAPNSVREKLNYALALLHGNREAEAVALLEQVQRLDPSLPHTWFNLGIYYKKSGEMEKALTEFQQMVKLVPDEPIAHYQLGTLLRSAGRNAEAIAECEKAAALNPQLAGPHFQLYNLYRQAARPDEAARNLATFQALKKQAEGAPIPEDVDWCFYGEIYDPPRVSAPIPAAGAPRYADRFLGRASGMLPIDASGNGHTDLLAWSASGVTLYRNGSELVKDSGLEKIAGAVSVAAGDFDNDGLMDLCVLTESGPKLYRNTKGHFMLYPATLPQRRFERAIWLDYDHDYDLDLLLIGKQSALIRNQGKAGFEDRTKDFPFVTARGTDALKLRAVPDTKAFDVAVFYADHAPVLYDDRLGGRYTVSEYKGAAPNHALLEADFDDDGRMDKAEIGGDGNLRLLLTARNRGNDGYAFVSTASRVSNWRRIASSR